MAEHTSGCRLSPDQQGDLTWYYCEAEAALGVRSSLGAQINMLQSRAMPERSREQARAAWDVWDVPLAGPQDAKARKWARADAELRAVWQTLAVSGASQGDCTRYGIAFDDVRHGDEQGLGLDFVTYEPDWTRIAGGAAQVRQRSRRVWGALRTMKEKPGGLRHELVLFRVYGPKTNVLQESKALARNEREIAELVPIFEYCPEITRRFDGSVDRRRVLELALRKPSVSLTRVLREQARDVLADACGAYGDAAEHETTGARNQKRARVMRLMQAAA
jgi:hypothetical protein